MTVIWLFNFYLMTIDFSPLLFDDNGQSFRYRFSSQLQLPVTQCQTLWNNQTYFAPQKIYFHFSHRNLLRKIDLILPRTCPITSASCASLIFSSSGITLHPVSICLYLNILVIWFRCVWGTISKSNEKTIGLPARPALHHLTRKVTWTGGAAVRKAKQE